MNITLKLIMAATALMAVAGGVIFNHINSDDNGNKDDQTGSHDMAIRNIPSAEPEPELNQ